MQERLYFTSELVFEAIPGELTLFVWHDHDKPRNEPFENAFTRDEASQLVGLIRRAYPELI